MITRIEARHYRSLRYVAQDVGRFQVLVGPNASGKSTFLDVVGFVGDVLRGGLSAAVEGDAQLRIASRAPDSSHLVWMRGKGGFELAVELDIPAERCRQLPTGGHGVARYEIAIDTGAVLGLASETLWLKPAEGAPPARNRQQRFFPSPAHPPKNIVVAPCKRSPQGWKKVVSRGEDPANVQFHSETTGWNGPFRIGPSKSALANLPEDEVRFPVATWVKDVLAEGVQRIVLASDAMRRPSPPGRTNTFLADGSNLPWVADHLHRSAPKRFQAWVEHVREALPDLDVVTTREREEDRRRYLVLRYRSGLEAPSWLVSDGTLRLLALTLLAYAPDTRGTVLIEEPENGIHPRAIETVFQSLSSVYGAQVLCATHSPVAVAMAKAADVLCFARDVEGATAIVRGDEHPQLREWKGEVDLGTLFASGVLG
ncbi:MAG: AAA family ATPase [Myxococcota bacterium]|nr:AAA family ATPase [Myxococcota bacterium]